MKLTYPVCCGVDVHKTFLVATIINSDSVTPKYKQKRFSTFYSGLLSFKQWLIENSLHGEYRQVLGPRLECS